MHVEQVCKQLMKITSNSGIYKLIIHNDDSYLKRENDKDSKFYMNNFSYFEISASLFQTPSTNKRHTLKLKGLIRGNTVLFFTIFRLRKPVARMTAEEQKLEGEFRYVNSRIITNR